MHFDWSFNAGTLISTVALIVTFVAAHVKNVEKITRIETKVDILMSERGKK